MKLSENFSLQELTKSQTATRKGIDNTPGPEHQNNLKSLCTHVLQPIRKHFGRVVTVSSGYRSPELCIAINSKPTSQHAKGEAADFEIFGVSNNKQGVKNMNYLDSTQKKDLGISDEEILENPKLILRQEISRRFKKFKDDYKKKLSLTTKGSRDKGNRSKTVFDSVVKGRKVITNSKILGANKTDTQKVDDWRKQLNKSEKIGNFGFTSFPVLTAAYLG